MSVIYNSIRTGRCDSRELKNESKMKALCVFAV